MMKHACLISFASAAALSACADMNTAVFATSSSLGINVDSKPPTASIAYDRTEGFIGPRFANGGAPPVVASIETGGSVFDPSVRQVYATGAAANKATMGPTAEDGPKDLSGTERQLMFFGTSTTVGLKVGFGTSGAPDSLLFGYRRKEVSVIPLATQTVDGKAVYPSVLASIDMNTTANTQLSTGLTNKQFFATGRAAENLATNPTVAAAFKAKSEDAALAGLTKEQRDAAIAKGTADRTTANERLNKIVAYITTNGALDKGKLEQLVTDANKEKRIVPEDLKSEKTLEGVRKSIANAQFVIDALYKVLPAS